MASQFGGPIPAGRAMLGYFSGEWVFLATLGICAAALLGDNAILSIDPSLHWAAAILRAAAFYGLLRIAGRTPVGIIYESHPAAKGHPLLSLAASLAILAVIGFHIMAR